MIKDTIKKIKDSLRVQEHTFGPVTVKGPRTVYPADLAKSIAEDNIFEENAKVVIDLTDAKIAAGVDINNTIFKGESTFKAGEHTSRIRINNSIVDNVQAEHIGEVYILGSMVKDTVYESPNARTIHSTLRNVHTDDTVNIYNSTLESDAQIRLDDVDIENVDFEPEQLAVLGRVSISNAVIDSSVTGLESVHLYPNTDFPTHQDFKDRVFHIAENISMLHFGFNPETIAETVITHETEFLNTREVVDVQVFEDAVSELEQASSKSNESSLSQ